MTVRKWRKKTAFIKLRGDKLPAKDATHLPDILTKGYVYILYHQDQRGREPVSGEPHVEVAIWPATSGFRTQYETYDMRELVPKKVSIHKNTTHQALQLDKLWTAYHFDERTAYVTMKSIDTIPRCNTRPIFLKKCIAFLLKCLIFF